MQSGSPSALNCFLGFGLPTSPEIFASSLSPQILTHAAEKGGSDEILRSWEAKRTKRIFAAPTLVEIFVRLGHLASVSALPKWFFGRRVTSVANLDSQSMLTRVVGRGIGFAPLSAIVKPGAAFSFFTACAKTKRQIMQDLRHATSATCPKLRPKTNLCPKNVGGATEFLATVVLKGACFETYCQYSTGYCVLLPPFAVYIFSRGGISVILHPRGNDFGRTGTSAVIGCVAEINLLRRKRGMGGFVLSPLPKFSLSSTKKVERDSFSWRKLLFPRGSRVFFFAVGVTAVYQVFAPEPTTAHKDRRIWKVRFRAATWGCAYFLPAFSFPVPP